MWGYMVRYGSVEVNVLSAIKLYPFYENIICLFADLVANADGTENGQQEIRLRSQTILPTFQFFYAVNNDV